MATANPKDRTFARHHSELEGGAVAAPEVPPTEPAQTSAAAPSVPPVEAPVVESAPEA